MRELVDRIRSEGKNLGDGILKVDGFINHQIDSNLARSIGVAFAREFTRRGIQDVTKVITAAVSGIGPALVTAAELEVPLIYARKTQPVTMPENVYRSRSPSHTKGGSSELIISPEFLGEEDRVLIVDDFLASGRTLDALVDLIQQAGARLRGIGCVIEKSFQGGRKHLSHLDVPIISLAVIDSMEDDQIEVRSGLVSAAS